MFIKISCNSMKKNTLYPFLTFLMVLIAGQIAFSSKLANHYTIKNLCVSIGEILNFIPLIVLEKKIGESITDNFDIFSITSKKKQENR